LPKCVPKSAKKGLILFPPPPHMTCMYPPPFPPSARPRTQQLFVQYNRYIQQQRSICGHGRQPNHAYRRTSRSFLTLRPSHITRCTQYEPLALPPPLDSSPQSAHPTTCHHFIPHHAQPCARVVRGGGRFCVCGFRSTGGLDADRDRSVECRSTGQQPKSKPLTGECRSTGQQHVSARNGVQRTPRRCDPARSCRQ